MTDLVQSKWACEGPQRERSGHHQTLVGNSGLRRGSSCSGVVSRQTEIGLNKANKLQQIGRSSVFFNFIELRPLFAAVC